MRDKKDEKLNELFREFAESGKMPDERVTQSAKQILECPETVPELALAPATAGARGGSPFTARRKQQIILVGVIMLAALLVVFYLLSRFFASASNIVLDWSQLYKITDGDTYENKDFVPFVQENTVTHYDEFGLSEESPYYEEYAGDVILYYVQYQSYGVTVDMLIEIDGFTLDELGGYQEIEDDYEVDDIVLYIELDDIAERTYVYFAFDTYQYYLEIHTIDMDLLYPILEEVVLSF